MMTSGSCKLWGNGDLIISLRVKPYGTGACVSLCNIKLDARQIVQGMSWWTVMLQEAEEKNADRDVSSSLNMRVDAAVKFLTVSEFSHRLW